MNAISFERMTANIGATVHGLDLVERYGDDVARTLQQWLHEHGVLFFESDEPFSDDDFRALASMFGESYLYEYNQGSRRSEDGLINQVGSPDKPPGQKTGANYWHTDGSSLERPPQAALLSPELLPSVGGDTMWASMTAAYDALSPHYQRMLDGMEALHTTAAVSRHMASRDDGGRFGEGGSCVHPVVLTDPVTRRKSLYVNSNYTERLVGLSDWESSSLLDMLFDHVNTPEFHVRLRWRPNTVAVWEERLTQHRGIADYTEPRTLRRITIRGGPLVV